MLGFLFVCFVGCCFVLTTQHVELPQPGIEPMPPALEAQSLNHWTTRELESCYFLKLCPIENGLEDTGKGKGKLG